VNTKWKRAWKKQKVKWGCAVTFWSGGVVFKVGSEKQKEHRIQICRAASGGFGKIRRKNKKKLERALGGK